MTPRISVVLSVFNGAAHLSRTVDSVLRQTERDLELIVIDDGSTDATPSLLAEHAARDERVRVITQPNTGLTRALIQGLEMARAPLIARQDAGDVSYPDRLRRLIEIMDERPQCVVAASEVAYVGPAGEALYTTTHGSRNVRAALRQGAIGDVVSLPHHGAAVMRTTAYRQVGGYRPVFYFAQDLDLWIRMAALGAVCIAPEILYEARLSLEGISSVHRAEQTALAKIAVALRDTATDVERTRLLSQAACIRPTKRPPTRAVQAAALYFIASCLRRRNNPRWRRYAAQALHRSPLHIRSWLLLLRGVMA